MLIVPALVLAVFTGLLAAILGLALGFGWLAALAAYWVAGNIVLMTLLVPRLLASRCDDCPAICTHPPRRPLARVVLATGWVTLGLAMVFWQAFHSDGLATRGTHSHDLGSMLGLDGGGAATGPGGAGYLAGPGAASLLRQIADHLLRLDLWVAGMLAYLGGMWRLLVIAAARSLPADLQSGPPADKR